jgi:hypothetical protein
VVFIIQHAKNYFLAPMYPILFAAGAVLFEQLVQAGQRAWLKRGYIVFLVAGGLLVSPMAIPVLPLEAHLAYMRIMSGTYAKSESFETGVFPQHFADRFGWEDLAAQVGNVYHALPPADQSHACIFTGNYGEAGALEFYSLRYGLPPVISGHNNYYIWGPRSCTGEVVIVVGGGSLDDLKQTFLDVQSAGQTKCDYCIPYENNLPIYIARGLKTPLEQLWPGVKTFQ